MKGVNARPGTSRSGTCPADPYAVANFGPESFKPPPPKPEGLTFWGEGYPYVHTVEEQDGLVYALGAKSGLYILRVTE